MRRPGATPFGPPAFPHPPSSSRLSAGFKELSLPWYSDQILPFDITLAFTNEYGAAAASKIYAVEILNEGYGISIDDGVSEMQATFVARGISPMQSAGNLGLESIGGATSFASYVETVYMPTVLSLLSAPVRKIYAGYFENTPVANL